MRAGWAGLIAGALFLPPPASAQVQLTLAAGPSFPLEELNRTGATGFHVAWQFGFTGTRLDARVDARLERFSRDAGGSLDGIGGMANLILPIGAARTSYLIGGVGATHVEPDGPEESGTELTFALGAGARISRFSLELRYLDAGEHARSIPVTFGIRLR